ncbi:hypothetical protein LWI29_032708 [Acer saccharum]|uniref:Exostosin GT47 domain-containing protein n=1 Tax=Acer saccharum TaxID=4024 RepID=A0AA39W937_ACESA|nr:hypothetical protein LWI29_032708 [Acer saccharum]
MEKPICVMFCTQQLWFAILVSFVLCFVLLCFDYSALSGSDNGSDDFIAPLSRNPLLVVVNQTDSVTLELTRENRVVDVKDSCLGQYIYVHDLPSKFNEDLIKNCHLFTRGTERNMCPYLVNLGLGSGIQNHEMVLLNDSWFSTSQFMLEVIFHNRLKNNYKCLTNDSSIASAIYVPFYAGLDISRRLWGVSTSERDSSALDLLNWLSVRPEWKKMWGRDHFLVAGRISWDFRRQTDNESDWGSKLRFFPESENMSMLSIESSSWNNDIAIPYPTCFHPSKEDQILQWQDKMRRQRRNHLFSFAGAPRPDLQDSIRGKIIDQCLVSGSGCKLLDCNYGATNCDNPVNVMKVFQSSVFCLQPPGDSYTRRSIFDTILAGCIPVFFHPGTAYAQYLWHLPKNYTTYSLYMPVREIKDWKVRIKETLLGIPEDRVVELREEVIRLIPRIIYADPSSKLERIEDDAFDLSVKGILERIERVRELIREGKDPSIGFSDEDDYKFTFSPYGGELNVTI